MYFPFFRGKRFELLALRNCIEKISSSKVVIPIVEPVKLDLKDLRSYLQVYTEHNQQNILVVNPKCGQLSGKMRQLEELKADVKSNHRNTGFAYWIDDGTSTGEVTAFLNTVGNTTKFYFIHESAYAVPAELLDFSRNQNFGGHIFIADGSSRAYQAQFREANCILIQDNFSKLARNADYAMACHQIES